MAAVMTTLPDNIADSETAARFLPWVDGVGAFLVCLGKRITLGGPAETSEQSDVALLANLSRHHGTLRRSGEGYVLEPQSPCWVGNRQVTEPTSLANGYLLRLGDSVSLRFRQPSVLSATAVLDFVSDHRPLYSVDGVVMMEDNCLLGPGRDHHIECSGWTDPVVLFLRDGQFWCKSQFPMTVAGKAAPEGGPIQPGDVVSNGGEVRFRLEKFV